MEWLILVSGGIVSEWWCDCKVARSLESGFFLIYDTESVVNIGSETESLSGKVDGAVS